MVVVCVINNLSYCTFVYGEQKTIIVKNRSINVSPYGKASHGKPK